MSATTNYERPAVARVWLYHNDTATVPGWGGVNCTVCDAVDAARAASGTPVSLDALSTAGNQLVVLEGTGFGPAEPSFLESVSYTSLTSGVTYDVPLSRCWYLKPHFQLLCATVSGVGTDYTWSMTVLGQRSVPSPVAFSMAYLAPVLESVSVRGVDGGPLTTAGGDTIVLHGTSFGSFFDSITVLLDGEEYPFTLTTPHTAVTLLSPELTGAKRSFEVALRVLDRTTPARTLVAAAPSISGLAVEFKTDAELFAADGSLGLCSAADLAGTADIVRLDGVNFGSDVTITTVTVAAVPCKVCFVDHDVVWLLSAPVIGQLVLSEATARGTVTAQAFYNRAALRQAPAPEALDPTTGPTAGGTTINIVGSDFKSQGVVYLEPLADRPAEDDAPQADTALECDVVSYSDTSIDCIVPAGVGFDYGVVVIGNGVIGRGDNDILFAYTPPVLEDVSPAIVPSVGAPITLEGAEFGVAAGAVAVSVGGQPCAVQTVAPTEVVCITPPGTAAAVDVRVTVGGQQSADALTLAYQRPTVNVTSLAPTHGPTTGGYPLFLSGQHFGPPGTPVVVELRQPGAAAAALPLVCSPAVNDTGSWGLGFAHTNLTCLVPELDNDGSSSALRVVVNTGDQLSQEVLTFSYDAPYVATVRTPAPERSALGGFVVVITGTSLSLFPTVTIGPSGCPVLSATHGSLECFAPPGLGANLSVIVSAGGQSSFGGCVCVSVCLSVSVSVSVCACLCLSVSMSVSMSVFVVFCFMSWWRVCFCRCCLSLLPVAWCLLLDEDGCCVGVSRALCRHHELRRPGSVFVGPAVVGRYRSVPAQRVRKELWVQSRHRRSRHLHRQSSGVHGGVFGG